MATQRANYERIHGGTCVFDRGRVEDNDPAARAGLNNHAHSDQHVVIGFRRTDRDRRPGRPLPPEMTGDPAPDRLERAEALRQIILANDARHRIEGSVDREPIYKDARVNGKGKGHAASTPDIEKPRATYIPVPPELAKFEARRDDQVLFFATASAAALCITGENLPKWTKAVQNVASGNTRKAFGWDFIRLQSDAPLRRGARRKVIR